MKARLWLWCFLPAAILLAAVAVQRYWPDSRGTSHATAAEVVNPFLPDDQPDVGWPFLRGPKYDGHSAEINLADQWPAEGPPVLWSRSLGQGYSAFVARGDRVFTQTQTLSGQSVICLHADTGEAIWQYRYDWPYDAAGVYPGPRATPTLYEDRVYFAGPTGLIGCLTADTGDLVWSVNIVEKYQARGVDFGYSCSPTVLEGRVLLPVGGRGASLVALSATDGKEIWRSGDDSASYTPAYPITHAGRKLAIGYLENALIACDRETGELVWREALSHGYDEHSAWPIYREGELWTSGPFRRGSTLWELPTDGSSLKTVWTTELLSNDVMSSVLVGEHLFGFDIRDPQAKTHRTSRGVFRCIEWSTGKAAWTNGDERQQRAEVNGDAIGHASLIAADGKLILLNDTGDLILARANPARYEELARASVLPGAIGWTPPALHRGRVYVRNHSQAVCIYVGRPELLEESLRDQAKTIDELPSSWQFDWTHLVLPVEPEYAFDIPSEQWLMNWFAWSAAILALSWLVVGICGLPFRQQHPTTVRSTALILATFGGLLGTSLLSRWRDDFVFTWPLAVYAVFHLAALWLPFSRRQLDRAVQRKSLLAGLAIVISGLCYFWLCRRLSLVFEWAFLAGYVPALGAVLLDHWVAARKWPSAIVSLALAAATLAGFAAFYWSGVALLWLRYG